MQKTDPPEVMTLVLAAIDDSWRNLQRTLSALTAREMQTPGVYGDWSIKDIIVHLTSREAELLTRIATDNHSDTTASDDPDLRLVNDKADMPAREIMAEFEQTHRLLKEALRKAPKSSFVHGTPLRQRIDESTVYHYQEHNVHIRSWLRSRRSQSAPPNNDKG